MLGICVLSPASLLHLQRLRVWADVETFVNQKLQLAVDMHGQQQGQPMPVMHSVAAEPQQMATVCCCLALLETLETCGPHPARQGDVLQPYVTLLVKLLTKLTRELTVQVQNMAQSGQLPPRRNPAPGSGTGETGLGPEYGTLAYAVAAVLRLCASRVLGMTDARKAVLQNVVGLLVGQNLRLIDPALFLEMLLVVEKWVMRPVDPSIPQPPPGDTDKQAAYAAATGCLTHKEAILLVQRLGMLERGGAVGESTSSIHAAFEAIFLRLMRQVLRDAPPEIVTQVGRWL